MLVDDVDARSDLTAKVGEAWHDFARALATAILSARPRAVIWRSRSIRPRAAPATRSTRSACSDAGRSARRAGGRQRRPAGGLADLGRDAVAEMVVLGWSPPGVVAGSGRDFGLIASDGRRRRGFAVVVTKTLRDIYGSPHPAFLDVHGPRRERCSDRRSSSLGTARVTPVTDRSSTSLRLSTRGFAPSKTRR